MAKKKKNRQNDTNRVQSSSGNDKSKRVLKLNGHLLLARNEAAAAILRAAMKQIETNSMPQVKRCYTSMEAFRQFLSFSGMFWKTLFQSLKSRSGSDTKEKVLSPERATERLSGVLKNCGISFVRWLGLVIAELWTILILILETIGKAVWRFLCFCGFQLVRFFRYIKNRMYWGKLRRSIKYRAWKEDSQKRSIERKAERKEVQAKKREEIEFRKAMKAEEEAFQKAKKKEEEAIRIAKQRRDEASRMTERIESELAALALKRKEEEDKVAAETRRKEEALAALSEANKEEEAERVRLEERRRIEEEARIEAERQEAEALKRLEAMQMAENERVRKAQEELKRLERELSEEAETRNKPQKEVSEPKKPEEVPAEKQPETIPAEKEQTVPAEDNAESPAAVKESPEEKPAEEVQESEPALTETAEIKPEETEPAAEQETEKPEADTGKTPSAQEPAAEESSEGEAVKESEPSGQTDAVHPSDTAEELDKKLTDAEEAYLESRVHEQRKAKPKKAAVAASAVHNAVRSLPAHIPTIAVHDNLDAKELITEARDNTNGIIYKVVKQLELPKATESIRNAVVAGAGKYALIGLAAALCIMIGTARSEMKPSAGTCFTVFLVIFLLGTALSAGISWLCGMLVKKGGGEDNSVILRQNSRYVPISALAYVLCCMILIFNKEKFVAVLIAVVLLSFIGHLMVMYREKRVEKRYSTLIYLLCLLLAAVVIIITALIFSSQLHVIWNALH